jgi:deoxyuridine 5'-triphosphate nucleotidohydrolase
MIYHRQMTFSQTPIAYPREALNCIQFTTKPQPSLIVLGKTYVGVSMLEALDLIRSNPDQYPTISLHDVEIHFQMLALFFQHPVIPTLGFKLCSELAVLPSKRLIDVGFDLTIIDVYQTISDKITMFETGVALDIPAGYYVELLPRSSMSKTGYMLANSVGVIDPAYSGTLKVPLIKVDSSMPDLQLPCKLAQLILKPYVYAHVAQVDYIQPTTRGSSGFGSTDLVQNGCDLTCNLICNGHNGLCTHA